MDSVMQSHIEGLAAAFRDLAAVGTSSAQAIAGLRRPLLRISRALRRAEKREHGPISRGWRRHIRREKAAARP